MLKIVINMIEDFLSSVAHSVERMREELRDTSGKSKTEMLAFEDNHWLNYSQKYEDIHQKLLAIYESSENTITEFVNGYRSYLEKLKIIQEKVDNKLENELVAHAMMLILMAIMTLDAIGLSERFGGLFLSFLVLYASVYFLYLWVQYLNFKNASETHYKTRKTQTLFPLSFLILALSFVGWLALSAFTTLSGVYYLFLSVLILALPIVIMAACISFGFKCSERYNKKFVTNHTLYILAASLLMSLCVYEIDYNGLPFGFSENIEASVNWHNHVGGILSDISCIRLSVVLFAVLNAFFIPFFAMFVYYQINTLYIKLLMIAKKRKASKDLAANREQFVDLVQQMLKREKTEQN